MLKKDLLLQGPFGLLEHNIEALVSEGGFGAVLSRAGVGKTAFLVQCALNNMVRSRNVLHISLSDSVDKVGIWYREFFQNFATHYTDQQLHDLWEAALPNRFIMTFKVDSFSVPRLEERLTDITTQGIFHPRMAVIDGLAFDEAARQPLADLKALAERHSFHIWFSVMTHRHEEQSPDDVPAHFSSVADLFDVALKLQPEGDTIHIRTLKSVSETSDHPTLSLDTATMLLRTEGVKSALDS